ncbi:hypothetical protein ABW20_dc0101581 [Dactylellina cionopaga]|nr:hypothetical protein ABW20_dc0101581 [Dactylellina cionopaga]
MTSTPFAAAGFHEPFTTPQKRYSVASTTNSSATNTADKPDAALLAATLSFSPPFSRQSSDDISTSTSPKTNGTALIAARAIGTGNSSPKTTANRSPDRRGSLSRNSSFDLLAPSPVHAGSLKAAQLSVSRRPSAGSGINVGVSRVKSYSELNSPPSLRTERSYSEDVSSTGYVHIDGSLIAAKLSAARKESLKGSPTVQVSRRNDSSPPSLLAAGLAVSRSTTPGTMSNSTQPERDQEPDILPPSGSVSEAKRRLLQQADTGDGSGQDIPARGRRSLEGPMRSKISGTFYDTPPQSTLNISPLSAAILAVQHSGRSAGARSGGPSPVSPKPRQPSPIKREIKRDGTPPIAAPIAPPPKPAILKKPTIQNIKITESITPASPSSPKPAPKPAALKKITVQETGTPPPQPIAPLPRRTKPPTRVLKSPTSGALASPTRDDSKSNTTVEIKMVEAVAVSAPKVEDSSEKAAPPLPLPRGTKTATEAPKPIEAGKPIEAPKPIETSKPTEPVRRDPRLMGFNTIKLPPPSASQASAEPVKQTPRTMKPPSPEPVKEALPLLPPKPSELVKSSEPLTRRLKPEPLKPQTYVDSIISRHPPSIYNMNEKSASSATLSALLPPPPATATFRSPSPRKSAGALRPNHTGPESTRTSPRPTPSWRDDLPFNFYSPDQLRPSHTGDSFHHAVLASSLASSRAGSPVKSNPIPLPPRPSPGLRTTMRSPDKNQERDISPPKKSHNILGKKHPNKHNEGARKRWREFVTEKERKRYEGLWAANRGIYLTEKMFEDRPDAAGRNYHQDAVCAVVVKDLWGRSRLPLDILQQIWDLVDRGPQPKWWLTREEFIMGLWLIDQSLKGRKLPGKVQDGTWESVRRMGVVLKGYEELGLKDKKVKKR